MPNQPKTPISGFRLDEETKDRLRRTAENMGVSMTEAIRRAVAVEQLHNAMREAMPEEAAHADAVLRAMDTLPRLTGAEYASLRRQFKGRRLDEVVSAVESILDGRGLTRPSP